MPGFEPTEPTDPTLSPVPWISNEFWQRRRQWSRFPGLRGPGDAEAFLEADPVVVPPEWRAARPPSEVLPPAPPTMSLADAPSSLTSTEDAGVVWNPVSWPMCCGSLAVLALANPTSAELAEFESQVGLQTDACFDDADGWRDDLDRIRSGAQPENGVNLFQCGVCGQTFGHHSHT